MVHRWDERTWVDGYRRGYVEGEAEGRYEGYRAQRSDLLHAYDRWGTDLRLGLHGPLTALEVLHGLQAIAMQMTAESMVRVGGECYGEERPTACIERALLERDEGEEATL